MISDIHGNLPNIPSTDLLIIAGDLCPATDHSLDFQQYWLETSFKYWLRDIDAKFKVFIFGNHDFIGEKRPSDVAKIFKNLKNVAYLQDSSVEFEGLNIYGSPYQLFYYDWAFNLYENDIKKKWELIPKNTDILVVHGPAYGIGDYAPRPKSGGEHTGSPSLLEKIKEIKPKLFVCGHIHSGYGKYSIDDTIAVNASLLNEKYELVNEPIMVNL
jgi:Icc-related predicted phosphoesterase